jgi:hypothetical protein
LKRRLLLLFIEVAGEGGTADMALAGRPAEVGCSGWVIRCGAPSNCRSEDVRTASGFKRLGVRTSGAGASCWLRFIEARRSLPCRLSVA